MPTSTEVAIATTTLGSAASSITFSSISSAYTDLRVVITCRSNTGSPNLLLQFNNTGGTAYSQTLIYGDGSIVESQRDTSTSSINLTYFGVGVTTGWRMYTADIFSYAGSTNKTVLAEGNEDANGSGRVSRRVGLWSNTSAITEVKLSLSANSFDVGTTATLYGIL